jgi:hypothetical protein
MREEKRKSENEKGTIRVRGNDRKRQKETERHKIRKTEGEN